MAIANVGISIPLAMKFGSIGSAIGTAFALVVANIIIINIYYHKKCGIDMVRYWKTFSVMTLKLVPSVVITALVKYFFPMTGILSVFVYGALFVGLYCLTVYFFVMNEYEKGLTNKYLGKVFSFFH